jgi:glyoxylase-like metal-dependent hydrolase (beta-lactamase superfamily II)
MRRVAPGVWQLSGFPPNAINIYLAGDVLIDAGTRWARRRICRQLQGRPLSLVALTHCHPDHQGSAKVVCEKFGVPLACHHADVDVMEGRRPMLPRTRPIFWSERHWAGPSHPVQRVLRDGDELAGFRVVHAPGHTPGHVIYFRESDRVALAGDVLANIHFLTGLPGLREPPKSFSADAESPIDARARTIAAVGRVLRSWAAAPQREVIRAVRYRLIVMILSCRYTPPWEPIAPPCRPFDPSSEGESFHDPQIHSWCLGLFVLCLSPEPPGPRAVL